MRFIKKTNWLLILILVIAFYLRFSGCKPGFAPYHSDEPMSHSSALGMIKNHNIDPERYDYPSLIPLMHVISYITFFIPARSLWEGKLFIPKVTEDVFYWSRYFTAFLGTVTVFVIYLIGKKLFNWKVGLLAAIILTFNYRHILNSHFGLPDIPNGLILSLSFLATLYLLEKPSWKRYVLNGILMGLFFSTKYQVFVVPPFLLAHLYVQLQKCQMSKFKCQIKSKVQSSNAKQKMQGLLRNLIDWKAILALLLIPVVFVLLNPYFFQNLQLALHQIKYVSLKYGVSRWKFYDFSYYYLFHVGIGRTASIAILLGMFGMLFKKVKEWLLLMSVVMPFFLVMTFYSRGGFYVRNFVTIIPLLTIFGGWTVTLMADVAARPWRANSFSWAAQGAAATMLILLIIWVPLKNSLVLIQAYQDDYNFRKVFWFMQHKIPDNVKIAAHSSVPIPDSRPIERVNFEQKDYYTLRELQEADINFAATNTDWDGNHFFWWMGGDGPYENFGQAPKTLLSGTFPALALLEIYQYSIAEFIKPWQAPESNFNIIKVPLLPNIEDKTLIKKFEFEKDNEDWETMGTYTDRLNLANIEEGLSLSADTTTYDAYFSSLQIPVQAGAKILVSAKLKNLQKIEEEKKDGFLRVDVFDADGVKITSYLGSRIFGESEWRTKEVFVDAPEDASFITVGFMIDNFNSGEFLIDNVEIYEVQTDAPEAYPELPYIEPKMNLDLLFPKSML